MSDIAIKVENLGKSYLVGRNAAQSERYTALRDVITRNTQNFIRKTRDMLAGRPIVQGDEVEEFWALKDINFEIKQGERVGIIGRNGAGKSTLLKILSRITEPTTGRVTLNGRVASLLEVGTGFHPELTGRENIYLNGAILGMSRVEVQRKFDEIVGFAEIERFLDTPVKRYSSGMYVRLAFAVAAHIEPEILIVDEVLAVGDAQFQKKCIGKMRDVERSGVTVLFVSHNASAIEALCDKVIYLNNGCLVSVGDVASQLAAYFLSTRSVSNAKISDPVILGDGVLLHEFSLFPACVKSCGLLNYKIAIKSDKDRILSELLILFYSAVGNRVAVLDLRTTVGGYEVTAKYGVCLTGSIKSFPLVEGEYSVGLFINTGTCFGDFLEILSISVLPKEGRGGLIPYSPSSKGFVELDASVSRINILQE